MKFKKIIFRLPLDRQTSPAFLAKNLKISTKNLLPKIKKKRGEILLENFLPFFYLVCTLCFQLFQLFFNTLVFLLQLFILGIRLQLGSDLLIFFLLLINLYFFLSNSSISLELDELFKKNKITIKEFFYARKQKRLIPEIRCSDNLGTSQKLKIL